MTSDLDPETGDRPPLFLLSFRQRDELAAIVARGGWQVMAARRGDAVGGRFDASGAVVALVDARGALEEGVRAARALSAASHRPRAMLACVSRSDLSALSAFYDAGATHFLLEPFGEEELLHALRYAGRGAEGGGENDDVRGSIGWRWDPAQGQVQLSPLLSQIFDLPQSVEPSQAIRMLPAEARRLVIRNLRTLGAPTAFILNVPPLGRVVHHLQHDQRSDRVMGLIEPPGSGPDVGMVLRDAVPRIRDEAGIRLWIDHALSEGQSVRIASVTLARLEVINTAYGRAVGDQLIESFARRIDEAMAPLPQPRPIVARLGGAGFALVSRHPLDSAVAVLEAALARPFVVAGEVLPVGADIGCVESAPGEDAATLLLRAGDPGASNGNGPSIDALAVQLRAAIEQDQVDIVWQPQVAIASGEIVGVEALARWRHPSLGELGAERLFSAAERAGMAMPLSEHVQALALSRAARWPEVLGELRLSINVTAEDVAGPDFVRLLLERVDASGFPRARLTVEITESGLMEELGEAARLLAELRRAGCRVAIDDFGTGYSSLAYLKALPLDYLKIDKALSQDITGTARDRIVVRGVIDMARSLGLAVVAEGVETDEQLELLAKEGCQYFQGFLCAPPLGQADLEAIVAR